MTLLEVEMRIIKLGLLFNIQIILLLILAFGTVLIAQQGVIRPLPESPTIQPITKEDVINSLQNERISELQMSTDKTELRLQALADQQGGTQRSVDRIVGLGIGFGSALTILQGLNVILQWRTGIRAAAR